MYKFWRLVFLIKHATLDATDLAEEEPFDPFSFTLFSARRYFWPGEGWFLPLRAQGFKIWNMINNPLVEWLLVIVPHPKPHVCATVGVICG